MSCEAVIGWRAWCDDGSYRIVRCNSREHSWEDVNNVLVIMLYFADGTRRIISGSNYYYCLGEGTLNGQWRQSRRRPNREDICIAEGFWTSDAVFALAELEAMSSEVAP
jgi:hypothetical protein